MLGRPRPNVDIHFLDDITVDNVIIFSILFVLFYLNSSSFFFLCGMVDLEPER